ncbi:ufm1-specific protease 2-like [Heptranchias perlo]|uniref:ufm1-specific protease 2-like n=1 Tax=Heptranchias perlo TaxID=212740 RepID=UPI00355976E7
MLPLDSTDLLFRIKGGLNLESVLNKTDEAAIKASISESIKDLISKVNSHAFILYGVESALYLWPKTRASTQPTELQENSNCKSILKFVPIEVNDYLKKIPKKKSVKITPLKVINLDLLFELTRPDVIENVIVHHDNMSRLHFKLVLPIDVAVFANPEDPWGKLQDQFVEAVSSQLSEMEKCIQKYTKGQSVPVPQAFHFELPEKTTLTTVIYPAGISDETLEPQRKELHTELGLGNKPFFRRSMVYQFPNDDLQNKYLRTVHKYIPLPDTEKFKISVVHGSYTYHHYLQDDINDSGWGCAYRSLQTIISWFKYQGYIDSPIPTHVEIQQMLVNIGDKAPDIVGSTDWIGSFELRTILNTMGLTAKVLSLRAGSDISAAARNLATHFEDQGTPVMVGGEPLAHTLLGVAWNEDSGETKYLILDAHYTGEDDWASVVDKGVEWKPEEFWDPSEPYNLCLPQRPDGV